METPLMKQYSAIKAKYPDALLLFRVGDFYETFGDDAIKASNILGIVLTRRANGAASFVELAGFPHHSIDTYLPKLVRAGLRVAICDQLEDPKLAKKIVKRGVTELVTPGVSFNDKVLNHKENNFLASIHLSFKESGISFLDISTGEFYLTQGTNEYLDKLIQSFKPSEIIIQKNKRNQFIEEFGENYYLTSFDDWVFTEDYARDLLLKHFQTNTLKGFGVEDFNMGIIAAGASLHYLAETQHHQSANIRKISRIEEDKYVWLDKFTIRNLELLHSPNENAATLIQVIDKTISPMGSRMMRKWITMPLKIKMSIEERLNVVEYLIDNPELSEIFRENIKLIGDIERLISKVAVGRVNPREVIQLVRGLHAIEKIKDGCAVTNNDPLKKIADQLNPCHVIRNKTEAELEADPPVSINKGHVFRQGVSEELDELRDLLYSGKEYLEKIRKTEAERTGIVSLKIGFNNVFGYYLEVTNAHKDKVPQEWERRQTLVNSERYITQELKEYEEKILGAEEKILEIETQLFNNLVLSLADYTEPIQLNSLLIARLDCLLSFATVAIKNNYIKPQINDSFIIDIKNGRHPVIENQMPPGEAYIPNNVYLDNKKQQIVIITGPNMSGKSALLRQTALIVLMSQMGCFVPASSASIGLVDKVFTRVGASDNISSGESTFMVEMNETASILNNISNRSLILLDEIGRGTSTYDGISIAWAITAYLHNHPAFRPKVMFATHYHELNEMATTMKRIKNYHVSVKEINNKVIFLRKLSPGGTEHSFGIHVAKIAGMPTEVIEHAEKMLKVLEKSHSQDELNKKLNLPHTDNDYQLSFIQLDDPLLLQIKDEIININIETLTPVEALMKLNHIKNMLIKK
ncbi:MAG: DNA mismatch repair protein MutS [Bacteroidales bacterium]|nr:DNA mismatch repair protein MutS [Bacteroidales bacterium]MDI9592148.1 DNA mismatch repair protein MutS [Bacteroidota bacterium]NLH33551.1 DNA mismatch repair protein MutS [Lentimicrobium sp.]MCO6467399.1 DNA mismatch repair protein MutS [Bacteroidales bacterium]MCZ2281798.1 DNA mismatch repair protein MutS [Bacteroidales bacterium]